MSDTMTFNCPECGHEMRLPVAFVGQQGKCSACNEVVTPTPVFDSLPQDEPGVVKSESNSSSAQPEAQPDPAIEQPPASEDVSLEMGNASFAEKNLTRDEYIIHAGRLHPLAKILYIGGFVAAILVQMGVGWIYFPQEEFSLDVFLRFTFLLLSSFISVPIGCVLYLGYRNISCTELVLTNKRVLFKTRRVSTKSRHLQLAKVGTVDFSQGPFESLIGSGRITVRDTGGTKVGVFRFLADALEFRTLILDQIDKISG